MALPPLPPWAKTVRTYLKRGRPWPDLDDVAAEDPAWATLLVQSQDHPWAQDHLLRQVPPVVIAHAVGLWLREFRRVVPTPWLEALAPHQGEVDVHEALMDGFRKAIQSMRNRTVAPSRVAWPALLAEIQGPPGWANALMRQALAVNLLAPCLDLSPYMDVEGETVSSSVLRTALSAGLDRLDARQAGSAWSRFVAWCSPEVRGGALLHALAEENGWAVGLMERNETAPIPLAAVAESFTALRLRAAFFTSLNAALSRDWVPVDLKERVFAVSAPYRAHLPVFEDRFRSQERETALRQRTAVTARQQRRRV